MKLSIDLTNNLIKPVRNYSSQVHKILFIPVTNILYYPKTLSEYALNILIIDRQITVMPFVFHDKNILPLLSRAQGQWRFIQILK